jgi:hypothetical protein
MRLIAVVICILIAAPCYAGFWRDINTDIEKSDADDFLHITAGAATSMLLLHYLPRDWPPVLRYGVAIAVPMGLSVIKEATDQSWSNSDIAATGAGVALGVGISFAF